MATHRRFTLRPWTLTLILCILYLAAIFLTNGGTVREFIWPARTQAAGYDGQFTYYIAIDPVKAADQIAALGDVPAYRYQRILHPVLARLLGLGQESLIPWAMLLIDVISLVVGTAALEQLLIAEGASRWFALVYGLFGGVFFAVRVTTTEPLAYGLVLLAILAGNRKHPIWQAMLLALAALAKETTLFFAAGYFLSFAFDRRWRNAVQLAIIAILPFALWQIFLRLWLGQFGIGSGGAMGTPFEIFPFNGIWRIAEANFSVFLLLGPLLLVEAVIPTVWALWRGLRDVIRRQWHPYVWLLVANAAIMPFVPFSTYREQFGILRFLDGLVICVILYAALRKARRPLMYATIWVLFGIVLIG